MRASVQRVLGERSRAVSLVRAAVAMRKQLEVVWSASTAHHSVDYATASSPSAGQCYVSSMAFARKIARRWPDMDVRICRGELFFKGHSAIVDHGWIEARVGDAVYLVDLTVEQGVPDYAVIAMSSREVRSRHLEYRAVEHRRLSTITSIDAWLRCWILEADLARTYGDGTAPARSIDA